jgi:hypothetical protein
MAYSDPTNKSDGDTLEIGDYNKLRDNWLAGALAAFAAKGDSWWATGANAGARLPAGANDSIIVYDDGESQGVATQIVPACRVYNDVAIDPATSSWVTLTFNSERFDTDTMHSTSTNTGRLTVPTDGDGLYLITGHVEFASSVNNPTLHVRILLNGATEIARQTHRLDSATGVDTTLTVSTLYSLSATDYVTLQVYTTEDVNVQASGNYSPEFSAIWQRRA